MPEPTPLTTSYWPAEPGEVRDVTVCELLRHAAATVPDLQTPLRFAKLLMGSERTSPTGETTEMVTPASHPADLLDEGAQ